jgi:hypothetical protein
MCYSHRMGVVVIDGKEDTSTTNQDFCCTKSAKERLHQEAIRVNVARAVYFIITYLFGMMFYPGATIIQ